MPRKPQQSPAKIPHGTQEVSKALPLSPPSEPPHCIRGVRPSQVGGTPPDHPHFPAPKIKRQVTENQQPRLATQILALFHAVAGFSGTGCIRAPRGRSCH